MVVQTSFAGFAFSALRKHVQLVHANNDTLKVNIPKSTTNKQTNKNFPPSLFLQTFSLVSYRVSLYRTYFLSWPLTVPTFSCLVPTSFWSYRSFGGSVPSFEDFVPIFPPEFPLERLRSGYSTFRQVALGQPVCRMKLPRKVLISKRKMVRKTARNFPEMFKPCSVVWNLSPALF